MELLLLKIVALLRPLVSIKYVEASFDVFGIGLFVVLVLALLVYSAVQKSLKMSVIDGIIVAFTLWVVAISIIYYESVDIGEVGKLLIPLLSYTLVKNVVLNQREYRHLILWIIVGFTIPTLVSGVLIVAESKTALHMVNYWTTVARWKGVYTGAHNLGHSMTLLLMTLVLYVTLRDTGGHERVAASKWVENILLGLLSIVALYSLYKSQVRSAVLGLIVFAVIYLYYYNKKLLVLGSVSLAVVAVMTVSYWLPDLLPEFAMRQRGIEVDTMDLGSGRPRLWLNDIMVFAERPIDEKLAGAGIGNRGGGDAMVIGHNDWLEMLTQTGLIGLALFATLQVLILKRIFRMQGKERYVFFALFAAVNLMMFVSNSYAWRIQVSQLYYMILAFIEIPSTRVQTESTPIRGGN